MNAERKVIPLQSKVCAFTGHRPEKLPWGTDETAPQCVALKQKLLQEVTALIKEGYDTFLCGMARGCDLYFFDTVYALKQEYPKIRIVAVIPCPTQSRNWSSFDQERYAKALESCDEVRVLSAFYYHGCMMMRNRHMIERCDLLLSIWDGSGGGTGGTISYARQKKIPIRSIWR